MILLLAAATVLTVDAKLLDTLPRVEARFTAHGTTQTCTGPLLWAVLAKAGVPGGKDVRGPLLATVVVARARDGYAVAFSLGELDPLLGAGKVIVAERCDGKPLAAADGPYRLVAPFEQRAARSVRQLTTLEVNRPKSPPP